MTFMGFMGWVRSSWFGSAYDELGTQPREPMNVHEPMNRLRFYVLLLSSSASYLFTSEIQQLPAGVFLVSQ